MILYPEDILKLLLALALGGLIGAERELRDKSAGFRTLMFIAVGSALFTIFSIRMALPGGADPTRIAAQIVSGVGFLGAGVILREHGEVRGLTTASTIWMVAALGMGVGAGQFLFSSLAAGVILLALIVFPGLERLMGQMRQVRTYTVTTRAEFKKREELETLIHHHRLVILGTRIDRDSSRMTCAWTVSGKPVDHIALERDLFHDVEIDQLTV